MNKCIICGTPTLNKKYCSQACMGKDETRKITAIKNLPNEHIWTEEEIEYLKQNYGVIHINEISHHLNIKKENIIAYATKHHIVSKRKWTEYDEQFLLNNRDKPLEFLCKHFNKSISAIINKFRDINGFDKLEISLQDFIFYYIKDELKIYCIQEIPINKFRTDIFIPSLLLDIEVQGSIWHVDSRIYYYKNLTELQKSRIEKDKRKNKEFKKHNIEILYLWEYDIISNPEKCKNIIKSKIESLIIKNHSIKKLDNFASTLYQGKEIVINYIKDELNLNVLENVNLWDCSADLLINSKFVVNIKECWLYGDSRVCLSNQLTSIQKKQIEVDRKQINKLEKKGLIVISIWEYDIVLNPQKIKDYLKKILIN